MVGFGIPIRSFSRGSRSGSGERYKVPVLVPIFNEPEHVVQEFVNSVQTGFDLRYEFCLVVGADSPDDVKNARTAAEHANSVEVVEIDSCRPKARALNRAVDRCVAESAILLDVDCIPDVKVFDSMVSAIDDGADFVEPLTLSPVSTFWQRAANSRTLAFQGSNEWLKSKLGVSFMGTQACMVRISSYRALGPLPEHGVEETFRWSLIGAARSIRHVLIAETLDTPSPPHWSGMFEQHRRWAAGQWQGVFEGLWTSGLSKPLSTAAGVSLLLQASLPVCVALAIIGRGRVRFVARLLVVALLSGEVARYAASSQTAAGREYNGKLNSLGGLALELFESAAVLAGLGSLMGIGRERWVPVR